MAGLGVQRPLEPHRDLSSTFSTLDWHLDLHLADICRQLPNGTLKHLALEVDRDALRLDRARHEMALNDTGSDEDRPEVVEFETQLVVRLRGTRHQPRVTVETPNESVVVLRDAPVTSKTHTIWIWTVLRHAGLFHL